MADTVLSKRLFNGFADKRREINGQRQRKLEERKCQKVTIQWSQVDSEAE
jgi:hypothetical protein